VGSLAVPLLYLIGREVYGEGPARGAMLLFLVTPAAIMYGVTSMDGVFMVCGLLSLWLFVRWWRGAPGAWLPLLLGASLALGTFMTYSLFFLGACLIVLTLLDPRRQWRRVLLGGTLALAGYLGVYLVLAALGFDPIRALRASILYDAHLMGTGVESVGRYFNQTIAQAMAFGFGVGFAVGGIWLRGIWAAIVAALSGRGRDAFAVGTGLTLLAMVFSSLFSFEVERVWLFMVPLLVLMAASHLSLLEARLGGRAVTYTTFALSAVQLVVAEALLSTFW
jgi:4-amino-4-deoxy-L-arabinose transferase-like glycosyltransferase